MSKKSMLYIMFFVAVGCIGAGAGIGIGLAQGLFAAGALLMMGVYVIAMLVD